jgi:hypothetical protein
VLEEAAQFAAAHHAGLIDHHHRARIQLLAATVQIAQEPVTGGHLLEPLALQAQGGDPGRGRGQEPVAVQLPGMPGDPEGEGLARARPPHDHRNPMAALAQVPDHRLLVLAGGRMGGQGLAHRLVGGDRRLFTCPAGGARDQPLLHGQEVGGRPAALLQGPVGDHADRLFGQESVGLRLQLGPSGTGQTGTQGDQDIRSGEGGRGRGQPLWTGQPIEQPTGHRIGHRPVLGVFACPAGHLPYEDVRVHASLGRLGPPPSIQGVWCLVLLGLAGGLDGPLDQPGCPLPTVRG